MSDTKDTRHQYPSTTVKFFRFLRWKPWHALKAGGAILWWFLRGARIPKTERYWFPTRRQYAGHILRLHVAKACCQKQHTYAVEEVPHDIWIRRMRDK